MIVSRQNRWLEFTRCATVALPLALCGVSVAVLWHVLHGLTIGVILGKLAHVAVHRLWLALILTGMSFAVLGVYDVLAAHLVAPWVSGSLAWLAGAAGNAVSNTLGFHAVTGPLARHRLYRRAGLDWPDTVRIMSLSWATLGLGFVAMLAVAVSVQGRWVIGGAILCLLGLLLFWLGRDGRRIGIMRLTIPGAPMAAMQMALGAVEMASAIGALYVLMPAPPSFAAFATAYIGAVLLGIISHAPGGVGVFEAAMLSLSGAHNHVEVLAALLLYRVIYNLLPFGAALLLLVGIEGAAILNSKADNAG